MSIFKHVYVGSCYDVDITCQYHMFIPWDYLLHLKFNYSNNIFYNCIWNFLGEEKVKFFSNFFSWLVSFLKFQFTSTDLDYVSWMIINLLINNLNFNYIIMPPNFYRNLRIFKMDVLQNSRKLIMLMLMNSLKFHFIYCTYTYI